MFSSRSLASASPVCSKVFVSILLFLQGTTALPAEVSDSGLAWHVRGTWRVEGDSATVRDGDAIKPASLLQPDETAGDHSITVMLPDGQHVLYECFTAADCARGFRVPSLIGRPDPFALDMLARVGAVLSRNRDALNEHHPDGALQTTRQEAVVVLDTANRVHVAGRITDLPNDHYTYDLRPRDHSSPPQFRRSIEKRIPSMEFTLPAAGLYDIIITDALNTPRIDLLVAAIKPSQSAHFESFHQARARMEKWNQDYAGWPIDDFLRAYLESLVENAKD
jgi:hypothetical protein